MENWQILVIIGSSTALFLCGVLLGRLIRKRETKPDGTLVIEQKEDRDVFRWIFELDPEEIKEKEHLYIRVEKERHSKE